MQLTVRAKMGIGFGLVLTAMLTGALVMANSLHIVRERAALVRSESLPFARKAATMKLMAVEIQQYLTDVSATFEEGGFEDSEKCAKTFRDNLTEFKKMYGRESDSKMLADTEAIGKTFEDMYAVGKHMAHVYMKDGRESGNIVMKDFDPKTDALAERIDKLQEQQFQEADNQVDAVVGDLSSDLTKQIILLVISLIIGIIAAIWVSKSILTQLGAEPALVAELASKLARGHFEAALKFRTGRESGVHSAMMDMAEKLQVAFEEVRDKQAQAEAKTGEAERSRLEAEEATCKAESAKAEGMLDAANKLEGVVEIVNSASEELSTQIEQSSRGAEEQSNRVSETATSMEEMNATVLEVAKSASQAAQTSDKAKHKAQAGADIVKEVVEGIAEVQKQALEMKNDMSSLGQQAQGIGQILNVISDIADQTNLLALNAAIEAARAGDAGRGFAVVADEVRKLAEKTMTATKEVGEAIRGIQGGTQKNITNVENAVQKIDNATNLASKSGEALGEIVTLVELATDQVRSIATASQQQSSASEEINRSIEDVSRISAETADSMRQSAQAVVELANQALVLKNIVEEMQAAGAGNGNNARAALPARSDKLHKALSDKIKSLPSRT